MTVGSLPCCIRLGGGRVLIERVWEETLDELDFAGVRQILESIKS